MSYAGAPFPAGTEDERELLLRWLGFLRGAVVRKAQGVSDDDARWTPEGGLIPLLGIVNHLTHVEWRWIDGGIFGADVDEEDDELTPGPELPVETAVAAYEERGRKTDEAIRSIPLNRACMREDGADLRWVVLHLINETARHAGHADATRELLDGTIGE